MSLPVVAGILGKQVNYRLPMLSLTNVFPKRTASTAESNSLPAFVLTT